MDVSPIRHWLLLEGLIRERRHWRDFAHVMTRFCPEAFVHYLDVAGTGTEAQRKGFWSIGEYAEDVRQRWLGLRVSHPGEWNLMTVSMGGMIGLEWTARHPVDFARHVVISTSVGGLSPLHHRIRWGAALRLVGTTLFSSVEKQEAAILRTTTNLMVDLPIWAAQCAAFARQAPVSLGNMIRQVWAVLRFQLSQVPRVPALVLSGAGDRLVDPRCSVALARLLGAPASVHPEGGHDLHVDAPEWIVRQVAGWLADRRVGEGRPGFDAGVKGSA